MHEKRLQFEPFLGLHDRLDDLFGQGFAARQPVDGLDHVGVGFPLVLQILGPTVIDVVLFGDLVQSIDAGIAALQALLAFCARPHVLIAGPVKFDPRLAQQLLNVKTTSTALSSLSPVGSSPSHNLAVDFISVSCPRPNLPNRLKISIVRFRSSSSFFVWVLLKTY